MKSVKETQPQQRMNVAYRSTSGHCAAAGISGGQGGEYNCPDTVQAIQYSKVDCEPEIDPPAPDTPNLVPDYEAR